jgi:predicted amidophosphoribosyltransferase
VSHEARSAATLLDQRRALGLCSLCGGRLTDKERALEGVGGSYVRCDDCVNELMHDPYFPYTDGDT